MDWIVDLLEIVFEGICEGWFYLMQRIVPNKMKNKKVRVLLKILVGIFSIALFMSVVIGVIFIFSNDGPSKSIGRYLIVIPLIISVLQIIAGIVIHIKKK